MVAINNKEPDIPRDWSFLELYDPVVHHYWQYLISYYGDKRFYLSDARQDAHFLVTLDAPDKHYKLWAQWNTFKSEEERALRDQLMREHLLGQCINVSAAQPSQTTDEYFINNVRMFAGNKKVWSDARKWSSLTQRMRKLGLILSTPEGDRNVGLDIINHDIDIEESKNIVAEGIVRLESDLFLRFI